ncbi:T9SS type A sorting domain-containing protein [Mesonia sp. K4-1]|uniref:T9SS type A sorting domain-containing protein n=1 Tax=Mesonia sp. K4-1 TaxID=2602760 RepID=UPI0011C8F190|nr:T9SS type A sorting domain-containing protein [Mesonia sp. K4-1]TXK73429.1 T9SS type A sorting domain-containing protein [Mesonia sp. K4-1]
MKQQLHYWTCLCLLILINTSLFGQSEGPDFPNTGNGPIYTLAAGINQFSGRVTTPSDGQDRFQIQLLSGQSITSINSTITQGNSPNGSFTIGSSTKTFPGGNISPVPSSPGTYSVLVAANFSVGENWTITINVTATPVCSMTASISSQTNIACNGSATGSLTVTPSSGVAPYTYLWDDGTAQTTATASGLSAGTYEVTVTDDNGCTANANATITEPTALVAASVVDANISCNGGTNGVATASAIGGTAPYTYLWSNSATTASLSGVAAGTYSVTITDANGCTDTSNVTITEPTALVAASVVDTNISCNAGADGSATGSATGGTAPYTYLWSNAATTASIVGIAAGTYNVTITDANGCTDTSSVTITEPAPLVASGVVDANVTCNARNEGAATASATGGTAPYTYLWSNAETTASITGLAAGTYNVTITDANGCTDASSVTITEPAPLVASGVVDANVTCNGGTDGAATVNISSGGAAPFTYLWSNSATTASLSGVAAGTYFVTITDANGCTATSSITITEPTALVATSVVDSNITCNAGTNGSATASATGGTAPYNYLWSNAATTASIVGVAAGTYSVTITDANGCIDTSSVTITEPTVLVAASVVDSNVSCNGGSEGNATASVTGGTAPYTYLWSNAATTASLVNVTAGTYNVTITDANGCTDTSSVTITEPTALVAASAVNINVTCNGGNDGAATASATGGTAPYTYLWSNAATTASIVGVTAGTYNVTITDANGCTDTSSVTITEPTALIASGVVDASVTCNGGNDGAATASATGGTAPYTYLWSNAATTASIVNVTAGTYNVTITDANGCTDTSSVIITEPAVLAASGMTTNLSCNGGNDGTIDISVSGGTAPYTYLWSNSATTEDMIGLTAGTYNVTVTDANGCTTTESVTLTEPTMLSALATATNVSCNGGNDGTVDLSVTGGTAPYTYAWDNTATTEDMIGLTAGTYNVTVTDANGCTATAAATITESTLLVTNGTITDVSCLGSADGSIDVTVTGGTTPYTYAWDNTATTEDLSGLTAGTYTVTITDANGCTDTVPFTVTTTPDITAPIADLMNLTDITAQCEVLTTDVPTPTATDNCGGVVTTTHNVTFPITTQGTTVITWTYTDVAGNTSTQTQNVIITDTTAPVADLVALADVTDQCQVLAGNVSIPTATDNCGGVVTATHNVTFPITAQGTTVITWTYTDVNGNTSTQTQNVIITDNTAPVADLPTLADVVMECEVLASDVTIPTATDNCGDPVTVTNDATFPISTQGITVVTWTYTDVNGNSSTQTQNIDVQPSPIANVSFSDATFTYDGNVQSIQVNNLPSGASVTYTTTPVTGQANGAIDVGVYTVTAVVSPPVTAVNCSPITLTATLTIEQATQTINFNALPILYIEDDVDFQLQATASSGLPVTYSYTYTSDDPAATVNTTGWVSLLTSGVIQITAQQAGNNNYLPAIDVIQALQINSRNANISGISLNGEVFTNPDLDLYYIIDCNDDQDEVRVVLETEVNASVNPSKEFIISTPQPGIFSQDIVVTSQDASATKAYTITVERRFGFFDIAEQKFDNVLLVNNNPQTNGGYRFVGYEWYINDRLVSTEQYYSAGDTSEDLLSENASYYLRLETENGEILQTCTGEVSLVHDFKASLYPNPNQPGRVLNIEMDGLGLTTNKEMEINLYSLQGSLIKQWKTQKQMTQVNLPESLMAGVYLVRCSIQGRHRNFKLIIE